MPYRRKGKSMKAKGRENIDSVGATRLLWKTTQFRKLSPSLEAPMLEMKKEILKETMLKRPKAPMTRYIVAGNSRRS